MQQPALVINWIAILVATATAFMIGGLWYSLLFVKPWAKEMGMKMDKKPSAKAMRKAFALQASGLFLTSYVIAHTVQVWRPSVWGVGMEAPGWQYGLMCAFFTWIGFYVPMQFGKIAWEMRSWKLFAINSGHDFVVLLAISEILACWR